MTEPKDGPSKGHGQQIANELFDLADSEQVERQKASAERASPHTSVSRRRATLMSLVVAVPILATVVAVNFAGDTLTSWFETRPSASVAREEAQRTLNDLVVEIEAFRKDYSELPETLVEVGMPSRGRWTYTAIDKIHYTVQGSMFGQAVSFDSTRDRQNAR
jgi:hypothetical protein